MKTIAIITVSIMFLVSIGGLFLVKYLEHNYGYGWLFKISWIAIIVFMLFFVFKILGPWVEKKYEK